MNDERNNIDSSFMRATVTSVSRKFSHQYNNEELRHKNWHQFSNQASIRQEA